MFTYYSRLIELCEKIPKWFNAKAIPVLEIAILSACISEAAG